MPYIKSKRLRIVFIALLVLSLSTGVGYLKWVSDSGTVVATAKPLSSPLNPANITIGVMNERPASGILTREQTIKFAPLTLSPDMGEVRLEIELIQLGAGGNRGQFASQSYTLTNDATGEVVFKKEEKGLLNPPPDKDKTTLTATTWSPVVGRIHVPQNGSYTFSATIEEWLLDSANISMTLIAKTGTVEADPRMIAGIFGMLFLSIFLLYLSTPPHLRVSKKKN